jgi:hypothetical protein
VSKVRVYFDPRDLWVGVYISYGSVYICPLPCVVIRIARKEPRHGSAG